jgi:hypothetical protein
MNIDNMLQHTLCGSTSGVTKTLLLGSQVTLCSSFNAGWFPTLYFGSALQVQKKKATAFPKDTARSPGTIVRWVGEMMNRWAFIFTVLDGTCGKSVLDGIATICCIC